MQAIPPQPVTYMVVGLVAIALVVLILPFRVKKIEENLEPFFLVMGILAVSVSGLWGWTLVEETLKSPVMIGRLPVGIFQVVLVFSFLIYFFNRSFCNGLTALAGKLGLKVFLFTFITVLGLLSSVITVIVVSVILSESVAALPFSRGDRIKIAVVTCFAAGLGAVLTPVGEPLSTILVYKLSVPPYNAGFFFPLQHFGALVIPGVVAIAVFGALYIGSRVSLSAEAGRYEYSETVRGIIARAVKVYIFVAALVLLGEGLRPLIEWYFTKIPPLALYWINIVSAVLDNATLTAIEIGPDMALSQIIAIIMGLLIAGGMLIPGNIPNIVAAAKLRISMKEWARLGIPMGMVLMVLYFVVLLFVYR